LCRVSIFLVAGFGYGIIVVLSELLQRPIGLGKDSEKTLHEKAEKTLIAIKEFKRYLEGVEKDLSRMSKKFSDREIAQGVGFAGTGIHEALTYLDIVKKVIEKTERMIAKKNIASGNETSGLEGNPMDGRTGVSGTT
jgi:hypothetical protein